MESKHTETTDKEQELVLWLARDKNGRLTLFRDEPMRDDIGDIWYTDNHGFFTVHGANLFPEVQWEDGPVMMTLRHADLGKA